MEKEDFKQARVLMGLSLKAMADLIGYASAGAIHDKETGRRPITKRDVLLLKHAAENGSKKKKK